jgi:DNA-binding NtrC family response regulator
MMCLLAHPWPGNVRELENVVERAVNLCADEDISAENLGLDLVVAGVGFVLKGLGPRPTIQELIDAYTAVTLNQFKDNTEQSARVLGISKRTLQRWLRKRGQSDDKTTPPVTT